MSEPSMSEKLFLIARVIKQNPDFCKEEDNTACTCVAVAAIKQMAELGLLNEQGKEMVKWVN